MASFLIEAVEMKRMRRAHSKVLAACARGLCVGAGALALAGCYSPHLPSEPIANDYRQRHPIALAEKERTVSVLVGSHRGGLLPAQRADVLSFAQAWKREGSGGIIIDVPRKTPNERAASEALRETQAILFAAEVPPQAVNVRPYHPTDPGKLAPIKLNYPRMMAEAGPCGLWPKDLGPNNDPLWHENRPYWNLGCATQKNFAAMVDNPADLVQPRGETPAYSPRRSQAIEKYRKGESATTTYTNTDQGKISDVGK
jgi:pilus assembly protein CpaD